MSNKKKNEYQKPETQETNFEFELVEEVSEPVDQEPQVEQLDKLIAQIVELERIAVVPICPFCHQVYPGVDPGTKMVCNRNCGRTVVITVSQK